MADMDSVVRYLQGLAQQGNDLAKALREKGLKRFARPLGVAGFVLFGSYHFFYKPFGARLVRLEQELVGARATAQYASRYHDLSERVQAFNSNLPSGKNVDRWLLDTVREAMKAEGIFFTDLSPVTMSPQGGFIIVQMSVGCRASYRNIASWIARMERSRKLLHVTQLVMNKDPIEIGMNDAKMSITTIVPKGSLEGP